MACRMEAMSGSRILPHHQSPFRRQVVCIIERLVWRHEIIRVVNFARTVIDRGTFHQSVIHCDLCAWKTNMATVHGFPIQSFRMPRIDGDGGAPTTAFTLERGGCREWVLHDTQHVALMILFGMCLSPERCVTSCGNFCRDNAGRRM